VDAVVMLHGDARQLPLADGSVQCVVTSPPYWGLRDYGLAPSVWDAAAGCAHVWGEYERNGMSGGIESAKVQIKGRENFQAFGASTQAHCTRCPAWRGVLGLEPTPELYVQHMVQVFREVRRVLRDDGTVWLNLGDSYCAAQGLNTDGSTRMAKSPTVVTPSPAPMRYGEMERGRSARLSGGGIRPARGNALGLKPKDLVGIPWRVAFALQADGWYLRADVIWAKPNPMPESVVDRPTKAHEYLFLLAKNQTYFYDAEAIKEPSQDHHPHYQDTTAEYAPLTTKRQNGDGKPTDIFKSYRRPVSGRNRRTVWTIATSPFPDAHFATFPEALVAPCILAGTSERGACAACGAPWARVVERNGGPPPGDHRLREPLQPCKTAHPTGTLAGSALSEIYRRYGMPTYETTGWHPTCACGTEQTEPCLVLDPFAGSGTVGAVAERLGRRWVGVDLKPEYLAMARTRTAQRGLVFA
jgi:DNA modification methylase